MPTTRLTPAALAFQHGVPYSTAFGDVYHAAGSGLEQARHVFLMGNRLPFRWAGRRRFTVLETGFGLGLNFLAAWAAWRSDPERCSQLHYVAIEKHPFIAADLEKIHAAYPELTEVSHALRTAWPPLVPGFHRLLLDQGRVVLTLVFGDVAECLPQIDAAADALFLDGFSPDKNPEMWAPAILSRLNRLSAPEATLTTSVAYADSAMMRQALSQAGFVCDRLPGFGHGQDLLAARFAPRWRLAPPAEPGERSAVVIGAGIAGSAACERLAARGWHVTLIERHDRPAQEASGNLAGIAMPLLSKDDNLVSRLARAAYLFALQSWRHLGGIGTGFAGEACGVLQLARDAAHAQMQQETVQSCAYPTDFVRWMDQRDVMALTGNGRSHGGWVFPGGGWLTPASLCHAMLEACGNRVEKRFAKTALKLERDGGSWVVRDEAGDTIAQARVVIVATGTQAGMLSQTQELPLAPIRGQVTHLPAAVLPDLPVVLCGEGYVTRAVQGINCIGASYDFDNDAQLRQDSHDGNLARLSQVLPNVSPQMLERVAAVPMAGRVGFRCVSPDRVPLVGALPDYSAAIGGSRLRDVPRVPDLHGLLAYGSRGLIWAPLAAEVLASKLEGDPLPVEADLYQALDPARFVLKAHRRSKSVPGDN